ncbi:MAG: DNA polymerase III subunit gamma and tau [Nocardioidaceae bacterium]
MQPSLALYRRYRPETFAELIGQDHVTEPLRAALANNRVNHAYLFSGPRGCGKTTSARILARALNCEQAPIADPCGQCQSCVDLGRDGAGSVDVIEIDAASHGGVDDARDLRERAFFAPVSSRYKVYIIDEAHMVSKQGFNALLKLVEEPPEHLKFIFATTEPDKVIPTIRSRTHHYPFRLISPRTLSDYLAQVCQQEGVAIEPAALPLVVRAGAGSARDSLSVLDQLLSGAGEAGVTHELATNLLGYTPTALLDGVVDALSARDGSAAFAAVDQVIEAGQDPEAFLRDLLSRMRDLVIISSVPNVKGTGLIEAPDDQLDKLVAQAAGFGKHEAVRAADILAAGLTELRGATPPRLLLELIIARVLLPGSDDAQQGFAARLDRIESQLSAGVPTPSVEPVVPPGQRSTAARRVEAPPSAANRPVRSEPAPQTSPPPTATPASQPTATPAPASPTQAPVGAGPSRTDLDRSWTAVLDRVKTKRRFTWILLSQNAQVSNLASGVLTVSFKNAGARESFNSSGSDELLRQALLDVLNVDWKIETDLDGGSGQPSAGETHGAPTAAPVAAVVDQVAPTREETASAPSVAKVRQEIAETRQSGSKQPEPDSNDAADYDVDDPDSEFSGPMGEELLTERLGAVVIHETNE